MLFHLCRSIPACPAVSIPDPLLPNQLSPLRAPLLSHHSQILPSYPTVSPTHQPHTLPICPSVPSTLPKNFLPAPLLSYPIKYLPRPPAPVTSSFSSSFPRLPAPIPSGPIPIYPTHPEVYQSFLILTHRVSYFTKLSDPNISFQHNILPQPL